MRTSHAGRVELSADAAELIASVRESPTPENQRALGRFILRSPDHLGAFYLVSVAESCLEQIRSEKEAALHRLASLSKAPPVPPTTLAEMLPRIPRPASDPFLFRHPVRIAAALLLFIICIGGLVYRELNPASSQRTPELVQTDPTPNLVYDQPGIFDPHPGLRLKLQSGKVTLKSSSNGKRWDAELLGATVYFSKQHDPSQALRVRSNHTSIYDVGTIFAVTSTQNVTRVVVEEGALRVERCADETDSGNRTPEDRHVMMTLQQGQSVSITEEQCDAPLAVQDVNTGRHVSKDAGKDPMIWLNAATVRETVEIFNRHYSDILIYVDPQVANLKLSGTVQVSNLQGFLYYLKKVMNIRVVNRAAPPGCTILYLEKAH